MQVKHKNGIRKDGVSTSTRLSTVLFKWVRRLNTESNHTVTAFTEQHIHCLSFHQDLVLLALAFKLNKARQCDTTVRRDVISPGKKGNASLLPMNTLTDTINHGLILMSIAINRSKNRSEQWMCLHVPTRII